MELLDSDILKDLNIILSKKSKEKITINSDLKSLGIDSLDTLDLVIEIEKKYNITLNDEKISQIKTVNDIVKLIKESRI